MTWMVIHHVDIVNPLLRILNTLLNLAMTKIKAAVLENFNS